METAFPVFSVRPEEDFFDIRGELLDIGLEILCQLIGVVQQLGQVESRRIIKWVAGEAIKLLI